MTKRQKKQQKVKMTINTKLKNKTKKFITKHGEQSGKVKCKICGNGLITDIHTGKLIHVSFLDRKYVYESHKPKPIKA